MASSGVNGGLELNSAGESPGTLRTPENNESDVLEEFYAFRDLICLELFRENVPRNTSALQGAGWVAEIMTAPHWGRFFDNIRMTKPCFYALVDALTSRGLPPQGLHRSDGRDVGTCLGPRVDQHRYRSRKGRLAQNVLTICDFDMNFTYVYVGWEGSAADACVLDNAVSQDPNFPFPPIAMAYRRYLESAGFPQEDHWTLNVEQRFMWMILDDNTRAPMRDDACAEKQMGHWARRLLRHFGYPYTRDQIRDQFYEFKSRFRQFHGITQIPGIHYDIETFVMVFSLELRPRASAIRRHYPLARRYYQYPEPHYPSMLEVWDPFRHTGIPVEAPDDTQNAESSNVGRSPVRGGEDAPIVISDSTAPSVQSHTHIPSWDAVEHVAHDDGGPWLARNTSLAARRSLNMGSEVGGYWIVD
ncbi:hypothetical protein Sango_0580100 [Sesamum angolense]|uniref:Uncharacterized protein n=1 Tax=Sesamum angolense TaxID=2727404 RepID=A0AAE1X601_9LAMI|nr:hypothetical protein Sango_0580100 [Sesamum angolense]